MLDKGKIIADLAMAPALGGDGVAAVAVPHAERTTYAPVAADPEVPRLVAGRRRRSRRPVQLRTLFVASRIQSEM
jgi:hypothetical protein